jgi:hypothetical protein
MRVTADGIHKLAMKLIESFSWQDPRKRGFERYWPLAGQLQTLSKHAVGQLEQEMAKALQNALESAIQDNRTAFLPHGCGRRGDIPQSQAVAADFPPLSSPRSLSVHAHPRRSTGAL